MNAKQYRVERLAEDRERKKLWDVLTALRGPDDGSESLKDATTAVIRWHVFGKTVVPGEPIINQDCEFFAQLRKSGKTALLLHFWNHVWSAFDALGLSMTEVNK